MSKRISLSMCMMLAITGCASSKKTAYDPKDSQASEQCSSTREYVAALEFLRDTKEFGIKEPDARAVALKVSRGCSNAGQRFIQVVELTRKAGLSSKDAIELGLKYAARSDRESEAFMSIFKYAFLADYLDLDLHAALWMAGQLSSHVDGESNDVIADFRDLAKYCAEAASMDLPRPRCADFATKLVQKVGPSTGRIYKAVREFLEFTRSDKGPGLSKTAALQILDEIPSLSEPAVRNFIQAYRFAVSKSGLALGEKDALAFAKEMNRRPGAAPAVGQN